MNPPDHDRLAGVLLGTAVGDSLGLPAEGMKPSAIERRGWKGNWKHRLLFGRGMWSDDTEHTIMLSQALLKAPENPTLFEKAFARELRGWLAGLPAGVGLATARSGLKLWLGIPPAHSGVFSAGNGPCMRAAIVGSFFANHPEQRRTYTRAHTYLTHTHPKALRAATAISELAALFSNSETIPDTSDQFEAVKGVDTDPEWEALISQLEISVEANHSMHRFLSESGIKPTRGISGYAYHTVPVVLFAGMKHNWQFEATLTEIYDAGGDTDTVGAIAGALCGALHGTDGIPVDWVDGISEWPVSTRHLKELAEALSKNSPIRIRPYWSPRLLVRNLFFLLVVLFHGFGRLLFLVTSRRQLQPSSPARS